MDLPEGAGRRPHVVRRGPQAVRARPHVARARPHAGRRRPQLNLTESVLLQNRNFGRIWISQLQSNLGTWLMVIAVPIFVFHLTGSPIGTSVAFIAESSPALMLAPFAGVLADRWNRRLVMAGSDVLRAVCVLCMMFAANSKLLWVVFVAVFAENSFAPGVRDRPFGAFRNDR